MAADSVLNIEYLENGEQAPETFFRDLVDRIVAKWRTILDRDLTAPPVSPADQDQYIVAASPTGDWSGQAGKIARWDEAADAWLFTTPIAGWQYWVADEAIPVAYNGTAWVNASTLYGTSGALLAANNLSDLANAATARTNIGLGNVNNTTDASKFAATAALTNKTIIDTSNVVEEITTVADSATPTPTGGSLRNFFTVTALAQAATFAAPSGTPANGNYLTIRIKDNGTARALTWNAIYRPIGFVLPTTTVANKVLYLGFRYNSQDSKWDGLAPAQEL